MLTKVVLVEEYPDLEVDDLYTYEGLGTYIISYIEHSKNNIYMRLYLEEE